MKKQITEVFLINNPDRTHVGFFRNNEHRSYGVNTHARMNRVMRIAKSFHVESALHAGIGFMSTKLFGE